MFTLRVAKAEKEYSAADNKMILTATVEFLNDRDELLETRKYGFPIETSSDELTTEMEKLVATYNSDYQNTLKADVENKADEAIDKIKNKEFTV